MCSNKIKKEVDGDINLIVFLDNSKYYTNNDHINLDILIEGGLFDKTPPLEKINVQLVKKVQLKGISESGEMVTNKFEEILCDNFIDIFHVKYGKTIKTKVKVPEKVQNSIDGKIIECCY